ncbi:sulfotransferase [Halioxenophilus sp. WMMB6]|uniref:sulfotransferase family protein n=1 Tax=Halioxenophilus sp. WMMB6 TaxID=3073815 RepID=UPI00295E7E64|nr:sulfotransferase [Halioxenophilus sp. WMMB6]
MGLDANKKPDFMIIGAMKCATSTLHDQLAQLDAVFMTTPKEPYFFSDDPVYAKGLGWYEGLYEAAETSDLKGESSTHYTKFPTYPETIKRIKEAGLGDIKLIYVMRHPVDRLISHYIHEWSQRVISCDIDTALGTNPELVSYSKYAYQIQHYLDEFPKERILFVFFESLRDNPQAVFTEVCQFLGIEGNPEWDFNLGASNVSSERLRKFPLYSLLVDSKPMTWLRQNLVPKWVRNKIKKGLTMKSRPVLSESSLAQINAEFGADLQALGKILGVEINLENYSSVAKQYIAGKAV